MLLEGPIHVANIILLDELVWVAFFNGMPENKPVKNTPFLTETLNYF